MRDLSEIEGLPTLTCGGVVLRPWRDDDAAAVAEMCDDEDVVRWMPLMPSPYTLRDGEEWVGDAARKWREEHWANFAAIRRETSSLVASCGLRVEAQHERGEIGYLVHREGRQQGVAAACVAALTDWALDELGLRRIEIRADVRNVASRRTAVAAGYRFEGVLRSAMTVGSERVDDALYAFVCGDARPWQEAAETSRARPSSALGWPRLTDGRLVVRPFEPGDAAAVRDACADPDIAHWIYRLPSPYTLTDAEDFIAGSRHRLLLGDRARLAVTAADGGRLLGSVSLDLSADGRAEVGYWVRRDARRRGVALGAARLIVAWAFGDLGLERLELLTYPGNRVSQAMASRLGFTREGLLRGFLPPEAGKDREGRVVPSADGSLPPRDDQVQFSLLRSDTTTPV